MAGDIIRPSALPSRTDPVASEVVPSDNGSVVGGVTWAAGVAAGRPLANQAEAEAGVNATKAMTPLTTKQAILKFAPTSDGDKGDVTVSDSGTVWDINAGSIDADKISDSATDRDAIAAKLRILSKDPDQKIYFNADTGNDDTGDGTKANPYKHYDRAKEDMAILTNGLCEIRGGGTVTDASRDPATMERPALFYVDQLKIGRRTDMDGSELVGGLVVKQEPDYPPLVLQPNSTYPRGFYVTGDPGSVGFQGFLIDCQTGTESGGVAHRGSYVQTKSIEVDGNGIATFGLVTEAKGFMENSDPNIHHVGTGVLFYPSTKMDLSLGTVINNTTTHAVHGAGGYISINDGATIDGDIFVDAGSFVSVRGSTTTVSGDIEVRATGQFSGSSFAHSGSQILNYGVVDLSAVSYDSYFLQRSGFHRFTGVKSFISPATQSSLRTPYDVQGGDGYVDAASNIINSEGASLAPKGRSLAQGHLFGLTLSNAADTVNDITVSAGAARDGTDTVNMVLPAAITKQLDATWAAGTNAGGLDTGSVANGTYFVWLIRNTTTGDVDALFSTSATAPTMPSGYGHKRRIGAVVRVGGTILQFTQDGDIFRLDVPVVDYSVAPNSASAVSVTLASLPNGAAFEAMIVAQMYDSTATASRAALVTSLAQTDTAPVTGALGQLQTTGSGGGGVFSTASLRIRTNTTRQIRYRLSAADADVFMRITSEGWIDTRGRLS